MFLSILVIIKTDLETGSKKQGVNLIFQLPSNLCIDIFTHTHIYIYIYIYIFFFSVAIHMLEKLEVLNQSILGEDAGAQELLLMKLVIYFFWEKLYLIEICSHRHRHT